MIEESSTSVPQASVPAQHGSWLSYCTRSTGLVEDTHDGGRICRVCYDKLSSFLRTCYNIFNIFDTTIQTQRSVFNEHAIEVIIAFAMPICILTMKTVESITCAAILTVRGGTPKKGLGHATLFVCHTHF